MCGEAMEALSWSYPVHILSCPPEPREQLNSVTAFIDASSVYGSTTEEEEELREAGGRGRVMVELVVVVGGGGQPLVRVGCGGGSCIWWRFGVEGVSAFSSYCLLLYYSSK